MKKVLLVSYGAGHINMLAPVLRRFLEDQRVLPVALALSVAKHTYTQQGLPYKTLLDYRDMIMGERAERYGRLLADRWHVKSSGLSREESVAYLGTSMRDLASDVGEVEAFRLIEAHGRQAFLPRWTMEQIIDVEQPDLILTTNSPRMERAATLVGNEKKIPTLNLHDDLGFMARDYLLSGDRIAVMSEITEENLIAQGHHADKIVVTGHPAFDPVLDELKRFQRDEIIRRLNLPEGPYLLLGTSQPGARGEIMEMCPLTYKAVAALGRYHLLIKPHPGEDADAYRAYAKRYQGKATVVTGVSIRELLFVSELLISFASTIMIEAILMGKPVISFNLTGQPDPLPFVKWGLGREARSEVDLVQAIQDILTVRGFRESFQEAQKHYFGAMTDGQATRRVATLAYTMMGVA